MCSDGSSTTAELWQNLIFPICEMGTTEHPSDTVRIEENENLRAVLVYN